MTIKQIENLIENLLEDNKENGKYYIHRTAIGPVFYDVSNGKIYTNKEYLEMFQSDSEYVDEYLYPFDSVDVDMLLKEHSLDLGAGWSISEEEYKKAVERNFQEHISDFFEKGLYAVETSIERTATSLEEGSQHQILSVQQQRERLRELLNKIGFGMNTSKENALLGALANRDELNTLLILEIPESCLGDLDNISQLFEKKDDVFETETAYRGVLKLDTVIPREYIKGAFFIGTKELYYSANEHFDRKKEVKNGIYNSQSIKSILENMQGCESVDGIQVENVLAIVESDFEVDNDVKKLKSRMSKISELVAKVDNKEAVANINRMIETIYEKTRNPLEIEYYKMQTLDFSQLSKDEISKHIENFVLRGSSTLKEFMEKSDYWNYDKMFEMYRSGLERLSKDALIQLKDDYRANNASSMVNGKLSDINRVISLLEQVAPLDELEIFGELSENDREKYNALLREVVKAKRKVCENSIVNLEHDAFLGGEIGKATVSVTTEKKDEAGIRIQRDEQEILQMSEDKMQE